MSDDDLVPENFQSIDRIAAFIQSQGNVSFCRMTISAHPVRSESESRELIDTLQTNLPHLPHARLFPWLYLRIRKGALWYGLRPIRKHIVS